MSTAFLIPTLALVRELYAMPRDRHRFERYLAALIDGDELALPLTAMNPMARPHVLAYVEALLALDAEQVAGAALQTLPSVERRFALVVADDLAGGWTNRSSIDYSHRFGDDTLGKRGFGVILLFVSQPASASYVVTETRMSVRRAIYRATHGVPRTLRDHLAQEQASSEGLGAYLDATDAPTLYACLYGDEAAIELGYPPLGVRATLTGN